MTPDHPPTVFISYSHDSPEHADRVLAFSDRLRADGIDCILDQYEDSPPEGFPRWMDRHIRSSDFVLMICTPTYYRRVMGDEEPGKGHGVAWESAVIYQYIYNAGTTNNRFIPILLEGAHETDIPIPWQGVKYYRPTTREGYDELYRRLTAQLLTPKPELGPLRSLPPRERSQDFIQQQPIKGSLQVIDNVPYHRNPYFTGRDTILKNLHDALGKDSATVITQGHAIYGLGGIGKTQTAVEFTYRYRSEYRYIFWVRADTEVALQTGFIEIARLLDLPEQNATSPADALQAVKHWLERNDQWLLVFDNADNPELLKAHYPRIPRGHILLTSRAHLFDTLGIARPLALEEMDPEEALDFLFKRTGRDPNEPKEKDAAEYLTSELGYLPLALEQATAYIIAKGARFQDYLVSYQRMGLALLNKASPRTGDYPSSIAKTWLLNFQEVEQDSTAVDILRVSAYLSPDAIPFELFIEGASQLGPVIAEALSDTEDLLALNEALEPLVHYSLIRLDVDTRTYSIHRMVQEVLKDQMEVEIQAQWVERIVRAIEHSFPEVDYLSWTRYERLIPHALVCATHIDRLHMPFPEALNMLYQTGYYFYQQGQYRETEPLWKSVLAMSEQILGSEHPATLNNIDNLAVLFAVQGKYEEAESLYQQALTLCESVLGLEHPATLHALNNLAVLYTDQDKYEEAGSLYQQAQTSCESVLGLENPTTLSVLENLANLYTDHGKYEEAELLYQQVLSTRNGLAADHPDIAISLSNLARLYSQQGKYEEAELLLQQALDIFLRVLGPDHPYTAKALRNLAIHYDSQGKYEEAKLLYHQAQTTCERVLGANHPDTIKAREYLDDLEEWIKQKTETKHSKSKNSHKQPRK